MDTQNREWRPQEARLRAYLALLLAANQRVNLTSVRDPGAAWDRHILDSLTLLPFLGAAHNVLDVGAGGGLPGMVLAIACPDLDLSLLEATGKKCRFLEDACEEMDLQNVEVINERAENAARFAEYREGFDCVTARAFAPLPVLLECTVPFAKVGGRILAMKGAKAPQELADAARAMDALSVSLLATHTVSAQPEAVILEFVQNATTPSAYPRRPGTPAKQPL